MMRKIETQEAGRMRLYSLLFLLEMVGNAAFAISGVMVARDHHMDLFGAVLLGCTTACGGGVIRDLLLGQIPPAMFVNPVYVIVAFVISAIAFTIEYICKVNGTVTSRLDKTKGATDRVLNAADSIGLAAFVVVGYQAAAKAGYASNGFLCIFVGVITGIGGGIMRDMLAGQMPLIMRKRVYGVAAIAGGIIYYICVRCGAAIAAASIVSIAATILLRFLAIHRRWNLPSL